MDEYGIKAKLIHGYLLPFEEEIMKLQDIMFFRRKRAAIIILFEMNAFFIFLKLMKPNAIILAEIICLSYANRDKLFYWFSDRFFRVKLYGKTIDAGKFRYSVAEISAFLCALVFMKDKIIRYTRNIIFARDFQRIFYTLFVIVLTTYIINLIGDINLLWIFANAFFFFPLAFSKYHHYII